MGMAETNVKCSACGKDTFCEQCQKEPGKEGLEHLCFECYQNKGGQVEQPETTHVCIPQEKLTEAYDRFLTDTTERAFDELWTMEKKKLKEMSKQELAKTSFMEGARFMLAFMRKMYEESEKKP
jgi:hypothetical protein